MKTRVIKVELTAHAHATEDVEKVLRALLNLLPSELRSRVRVHREVLQGHYSNPITRLTAIVEGEDAVKVLEYLAKIMDRYDKEVISVSLPSRYDKRTGRVFIRFSKQDAYLGRVRVAEGDDVVRLVVTLQGTPSVKAVSEVLRALGLTP